MTPQRGRDPGCDYELRSRDDRRPNCTYLVDVYRLGALASKIRNAGPWRVRAGCKCNRHSRDRSQSLVAPLVDLAAT